MSATHPPAPGLGAEIISFGYGHGPAPVAHVTIDLRAHFRDPHASPRLRGLTAESPEVMDAVLATPGIADLIRATEYMALAYRAGPCGGPIVIAVGCVGGRHRSAAAAELIAAGLRCQAVPVRVTHRDISKPVIVRPTAGGAG